MNFDFVPKLFIGKYMRIFGITVGVGTAIPLSVLFGRSSSSTSTSSTAQSSANKMGPQVLKGTHLAYHEPVFVVKKGLFSGSPVAAEFVTELPDNKVRVREVDSGKTVDVPRELLHLRYR